VSRRNTSTGPNMKRNVITWMWNHENDLEKLRSYYKIPWKTFRPRLLRFWYLLSIKKISQIKNDERKQNTPRKKNIQKFLEKKVDFRKSQDEFALAPESSEENYNKIKKLTRKWKCEDEFNAPKISRFHYYMKRRQKLNPGGKRVRRKSIYLNLGFLEFL